MEDLRDKVAIVTGSNSGLGRETAAELGKRGATVILACRNTNAALRVAEAIKAQTPGANIEVGPQLDLASQASIRAFAAEYSKSGRPLHILVANAGADFNTKRKTEAGVPILCQVNYLGHYALARLLEPVLIASAPSRIVNVSSITHRYGNVRPVARFLSQPEHGTYSDTKLAQVLFTYEAQRRLGPLGVQSAAVDPGGVITNVWKGRFAKPPFSWLIHGLFSPSYDGAKAIVHAATVDLGKDQPAPAPLRKGRQGVTSGTLRFYAKGTFAWPAVYLYTPTDGALGQVKQWLWMATAAILAGVDWPIRNSSKGRLLSTVKRIPSMSQTYDQALAKELWEQSAKLANLPADPQLPETATGRGKLRPQNTRWSSYRGTAL